MVSHDASDADLDVDLLAASLRADASDLATFTEVLAVKLSEALPGGVDIDRGREGLFGPKHVRAVAVSLDDQRFALRLDRGGVTTSCARLSGGIVLKTESVGTDEWLRRLSEALAAQAQNSQITRQALERLLNA
jgi:hypothetical protein